MMMPLGRIVNRRCAILTSILNSAAVPSALCTGTHTFTTSSKRNNSCNEPSRNSTSIRRTAHVESPKFIHLLGPPSRLAQLSFAPTPHSTTDPLRLHRLSYYKQYLKLSPYTYNTPNFNFPCPSKHQGSCRLPPCFEVFEKTDETTSDCVEAPHGGVVYEKRAARLIVIRKRKMKKHKLQKLRKKMKFEWAKVRQRREMRKEKAFQAELLCQIKEAEKFDAAEYVADKLRKAHEVPIPRTWKGKRLPEFIIKEKLGIK